MIGYSKPQKEMVNHPSHYNDYDVEVIEMMRRIWGDEAVRYFCLLNAFKYRMRAGHKGGNSIEQDFKKEKFYLDYVKSMQRDGEDDDENEGGMD